MKSTLFFAAAISLLTLNACTSDNRQNNENDNTEVNTRQGTPVKMIEYLVGEWQMDGEAGGGGNSNEREAPGERITFTSEARYIIHRGNQKVDSGAYRMNEQLNNLYLESEANESPREFEMNLKSDAMTLRPRGSDKGVGELSYRRVGPASVRPERSAEGDETEKTEPR